MIITFWQVAFIFLLSRNVLSSWLNDGEESGRKSVHHIYTCLTYLIVFYMQGFFSSFGWPQYALTALYALVFVSVLANSISKEKFINGKSKVSFYDSSFASFQMAVIAYYGGFFNGMSLV